MIDDPCDPLFFDRRPSPASLHFFQPQRTPVANIKSQIKRNRQSEKARLRNKAVRSEMKTRTKRVLAAADEGSADIAEQARLAIKRIDTAAQKGVIHKNQAARRKSRLMARVNAALN
ncbi:MAG: 30S ribosomal protein S20 [Acidimicrobiales bacterium]